MRRRQTQAVLSKLIGALHHRGPDGTGHAVVGRVALLHNRLAIIDLVTGDQPLFAGAATLVANGEIYNYRELRAGLPNVAFSHQQRLRAAAASLAARRGRTTRSNCVACTASRSMSACGAPSP